MKKVLVHLSDSKQNELKHIVSVVRNLCDNVEMIILFGSYARGDYKDEYDLKPDRKSGHKSDYDILVVTKEKSVAIDTSLWGQITKECNNSGLSAYLQIITHDIQELNIKLAEGQYFYTDIKKEGCLLYDSGNFKLACKRKLRSDEQQRIAQDYFAHWFGSANTFFRYVFPSIKNGDNNYAAFNLHQAAEHSYKTILLVFTNYTPNEHILGLLSDMATEYDTELENIFPQKTREERDRFKLLDYAYIGARYDSDYRISKEDLEYLSKRVGILLNLTEKICKLKIAKGQTDS